VVQILDTGCWIDVIIIDNQKYAIQLQRAEEYLTIFIIVDDCLSRIQGPASSICNKKNQVATISGNILPILFFSAPIDDFKKNG
jgi:hypothetical protein